MTDKKVTAKKASPKVERKSKTSTSSSAVPQSREAKKAPASTGLSVPAFDLAGKSAGTVTLPKEIFGQKVNRSLIAQAVRVYQNNMSTHTANTKTRGQVHGGGTKPWRQKGTGRARAGSSRSPLWVGGGKVFGPQYRDVKLAIPQKIKHAALISALSARAAASEIKIIVGLEKVTPKTATIAGLLKATGTKGSTLFVVPQKNENLKLASRNLQRVELDVASNLNAYTVTAYKNILFSKEAIESIK